MKFSESADLIDIRYDNVFKAVFTRNTPQSLGALSKLISSLINRDISVTSLNANEPPAENLLDRQIRFDIACKAINGELINVEMCLNPNLFELVRLEYHAARLYIGQDIKGSEKTFNDLKESYQIAILAKKRFFKDETVLHTFEYYDAEHNVSLNGKCRIITIELSKTDKVILRPPEEMSPAEQWATFFEYLTDKTKREKINQIIECQEGIKMASEVLVEFTKDEIEHYRRESELKYELDMQSRIVYAKREAEREGRAEGIIEGKLEGRLEGKHEADEEWKKVVVEKDEIIARLQAELEKRK